MLIVNQPLAKAPLPPMLSLAIAALGHALRESPTLATSWPFITRRELLQSPIKTSSGGRPRSLTVDQVETLAEAIKSGASITVAARRAEMGRASALRILTGNHWMSRHPLVLQLAVHSQRSKGSQTSPEPAHNRPKPPTSRDRAPAAGAVAQNHSDRPNAAFSEAGFEAALTPSESAPA